MKKSWLKTGLAVCMFIFLQGSLYSEPGDTEKTRALNRDIVLLNLINGLYLTPEQTQILIEKIEMAEQIRNEFLLEVDQQQQMLMEFIPSLYLLAGQGQ